MMRQKIHFLHLGKNAGTQFKFCAAQVNAFSKSHVFTLHKHEKVLADLAKGSLYAFVTRDPVTRFRSGFYSRKRRGQPRTYVDWRKAEAVAFSRFEHANQLAESLYEETERGDQARSAMAAIRHVCQHQHSWFEAEPDFLNTRPPVAILRQEFFRDDLLAMYRQLGIEVEPVFATDRLNTHKNDYSNTQPLSNNARENLRRWYAADIAFIAECNAWRAQQAQC